MTDVNQSSEKKPHTIKSKGNQTEKKEMQIPENKNGSLQYRETVEYIDGYKIVNKYPILTKEENEKRKEEILLKLYYEFNNMREQS